MSLYDHRVKIVAAALMKGSHGSELTNDAAIQLAVRAVYALDHIPVRGDDDNREAGRNP